MNLFEMLTLDFYLSLKLNGTVLTCVFSNWEWVKESFFLFPADMIEKEMRKLFSIPDEKETRLWNRYMTNTFEPLNKPDSTIQDAGLYQGQVWKLHVELIITNSWSVKITDIWTVFTTTSEGSALESPKLTNETTNLCCPQVSLCRCLHHLNVQQVIMACRGQSHEGLHHFHVFLLLSLWCTALEIM